jgi:hypothetical protein
VRGESDTEPRKQEKEGLNQNRTKEELSESSLQKFIKSLSERRRVTVLESGEKERRGEEKERGEERRA